MKLAGLLLAGTLALGAQAPASVPVDEEPKHKVVFKNDFIRVLDATLPAGYVTLNHAHAVDNISVTISNGREGDAAGRGIGRAGFSKGGYAHTVTNSGPGVMRYIVVEPLKADRPKAAAAVFPNHTLETENERVRIYRVKLAAGESIEAHAHAAGRLEVTVTGPSGPGASLWIAGGENHPLKAAAAALEIVEIEPK
jgi:quercetin dioxygenase-like cupin family protein